MCCNINFGQGYWERLRVEGTRTRDTGKRHENLSLHTPYLLQATPWLLFPELREILIIN